MKGLLLCATILAIWAGAIMLAAATAPTSDPHTISVIRS